MLPCRARGVEERETGVDAPVYRVPVNRPGVAADVREVAANDQGVACRVEWELFPGGVGVWGRGAKRVIVAEGRVPGDGQPTLDVGRGGYGEVAEDQSVVVRGEAERRENLAAFQSLQTERGASLRRRLGVVAPQAGGEKTDYGGADDGGTPVWVKSILGRSATDLLPIRSSLRRHRAAGQRVALVARARGGRMLMEVWAKSTCLKNGLRRFQMLTGNQREGGRSLSCHDQQELCHRSAPTRAIFIRSRHLTG